MAGGRQPELSRETVWALSLKKINRLLRSFLPHWFPKSFSSIVFFPDITDFAFLILYGRGWRWAPLLQDTRNAWQKDISKAPRLWNVLAFTLWVHPETAIPKGQNQLDIVWSYVWAWVFVNHLLHVTHFSYKWSCDTLCSPKSLDLPTPLYPLPLYVPSSQILRNNPIK